MNLLFAAQSGWGKSFHSQAWLEQNIPHYETSIILDFKDEYRGLVKHGLCRYCIAGPKELATWSTAEFMTLLRQNQHVVLARHEELTTEEWQEICRRAIAAGRRMDSCLIAIDEAHFVAPQSGKVPDEIEGLATTGRGEGASGVWITQRLAKIEETVASQCQARMLGGFESTADKNKVEDLVEYPADLHNPQVRTLSASIPDELAPTHRDPPPWSLQKHEDDDGNTIGSEWIYSNNKGERQRVDTRNISMDSTHYGSQGNPLEMPTYG
ncbi:ATP-binding protein [Haladaptatus sp. DYF46]|uniref:ATP-binding protein n=1 Tax=Haladaptatus sp. DYF46 TaxID=2886041 RepID=UPI001E2C80A5|nr:ATP-binding protein [Haladaptatus sp. DYF46]